MFLHISRGRPFLNICQSHWLQWNRPFIASVTLLLSFTIVAGWGVWGVVRCACQAMAITDFPLSLTFVSRLITWCSLYSTWTMNFVHSGVLMNKIGNWVKHKRKGFGQEKHETRVYGALSDSHRKIIHNETFLVCWRFKSELFTC